ncbi:MAG: glycosyltransferase family 39 protein [Myxococcales bacterium]|nr:glycosyltransferase family 39 protein [Myxococcales bacterium]
MVIALAVALLGALLRLGLIDLQELWLDEACTAHFATLPWPEFWASFAHESHPPLYYAAVRGSIALFGLEPWALRLPSWIAATLGSVAIGLLGARLGGLRGALTASVMATLAPIASYYAVEARPYAMAAGLCACFFATWEAALRTRRTGWTALTALLGLAAAMSHYYAMLVVCVAPLTALVPILDRRWGGPSPREADPPRTRPVAAALLVALLPAVATVAWIAFVGTADVGAGSKQWLVAAFPGAAAAIRDSLLSLAGAGPYPEYLGALGLLPVPTWVAPLGSLGAAGLFLSAVIRSRDGGMATPSSALGRSALLAGWLGPLLIAIGFSALVKPVFLAGRYELVGLPALMVLLSLGFSEPRSRLRDWLGGVSFAAWTLAQVAFTVVWLRSDFARPTEAVHALLQRVQTVDAPPVAAVHAVGFSYAPLAALEKRTPTGTPVLAVPRGLTEHPGWWATPPSGAPVDPTELPVPPMDGREVWVVRQRGDGLSRYADAAGQRLFAAGYRPGVPIDIDGVVLVRFSAADASPDSGAPTRPGRAGSLVPLGAGP